MTHTTHQYVEVTVLHKCYRESTGLLMLGVVMHLVRRMVEFSDGEVSRFMQ